MFMQVKVVDAVLQAVKNGELSHSFNPVPQYGTDLAAGADLVAREDCVLRPGGMANVPTGIAFEIPIGFAGEVRSRSGLYFKHGVLAFPGTIDADYRGEVMVGLENRGFDIVEIKAGDRIAQIVFSPVCQAEMKVSAKLGKTARGTGGFGSTGVK